MPAWGYEPDLRVQLAEIQTRFYTLEEEHRLALSMLQNACRLLHEIKDENAALRMQCQILQGGAQLPGSQGGAFLQRSVTSTSCAETRSPSDMDVPIPALLGSFQRSSSSSSKELSASWGQSRRSSRDMSVVGVSVVGADLLQAVQSLMPSGYAAAAAANATAPSAASLQHQLSCLQTRSQSAALDPDGSQGASLQHRLNALQMRQQLAALESEGSQGAAPQQNPNVLQIRQHLAALESDSVQLPFQHGGEGSAAFEPDQQHRQPSSELSEKAQSSRKAFESWMTTIVIRNVPARYTQDRLLEVWPPDGSYNFLYLPYSVRQKRGSGYVFINFCTHQAACDFWQKVQGTRLSGCEHLKSLDVATADVQGLENNLRYWGDRKLNRINNANFLPIVFQGTKLVDFKEQVAAYNVGAPTWSPEAESSYSESYMGEAIEAITF